jgi:hypothetical protein
MSNEPEKRAGLGKQGVRIMIWSMDINWRSDGFNIRKKHQGVYLEHAT